MNPTLPNFRRMGEGHPLDYLLSLRRSPGWGQTAGLVALFGLPCILLCRFEPSLAESFLIASAVGLLILLPCYQTSGTLGLLSSLRRRGCLEELASCGLSARGCADALAWRRLGEALRLGLPVLLVLTAFTQGAGLSGHRALALWLPAIMYLTVLGTYASFWLTGGARSWRRRAFQLLQLGALALLASALPLWLTLPALLLAARQQVPDWRLAGTQAAPQTRWRNRWMRPLGDNPIVVRESWRSSSLPGHLPGYLLMRLTGIVLPVLWAQQVFTTEKPWVYWLGLLLIGMTFFVRAALRTLNAILGEREHATWETLSQTGFTVTQFLKGWMQVGTQALLLEAIPVVFLAIFLAGCFPGELMNPGLAWLGALALVGLIGAGAAVGLSLSATSANRREATAHLVGTVLLGLITWGVSWWAVIFASSVVGLGETWVEVIAPLLCLLYLCVRAARRGLADARTHLSLATVGVAVPLRYGLGTVGAAVFAVTAAQQCWHAGPSQEFALVEVSMSAAFFALPGLVAGRLLDWWWRPLLATVRWRTGLGALLGATLGVVGALTPRLLKVCLALWDLTVGQVFPPAGELPPLAPALALGLLLGALLGACLQLLRSPASAQRSFVSRSRPVLAALSAISVGVAVFWWAYCPAVIDPAPGARARQRTFAPVNRRDNSGACKLAWTDRLRTDPELAAFLKTSALWDLDQNQPLKAARASLQAALLGNGDDFYQVRVILKMQRALDHKVLLADLERAAHSRMWSESLYLRADDLLQNLDEPLRTAQRNRLANEWARVSPYLDRLEVPPPSSDRWLVQVLPDWNDALGERRLTLLRLEALRWMLRGLPRHDAVLETPWAHRDDHVVWREGLLILSVLGVEEVFSDQR